MSPRRMPKEAEQLLSSPPLLKGSTAQARYHELNEDDYPNISDKQKIRRAKKCFNERESKKRELKEALGRQRFFEETISSQRADIQRLKDLLVEERAKIESLEGTMRSQSEEIQCLKDFLKEKCLRENSFMEANRFQMDEIQRLKEELNRITLLNIVNLL